MSIFIKGMKMPQLEKNETMQITLWNDDGIMRMGIQTGGYWCSQEWTLYPVMEISTPHGRLIDESTIMQILNERGYYNYSDIPTVIEAEE